ncbi:hypothetical protein D3C84_1232750 [compost metagenome]
MNHHRIAAALIISLAPYLLKNMLRAEHLLRMACEQIQNIEFLRSQLDPVIVQGNRALLLINR